MATGQCATHCFWFGYSSNRVKPASRSTWGHSIYSASPKRRHTNTETELAGAGTRGASSTAPRNFSALRDSLRQLRSKVERMKRDWDRRDAYQRRRYVEALGKLVEADRAIREAAQEYIRAQREALA